MSRLSDGEREFVSDFGDLGSQAPEPRALTTAPVPPPASAGVHEIDARELAAPLPLLEAHRALRMMHPGEELRVVTSYEGSVAEFQALARYDMSLDLVSQDIVGERFVHVLRKRR
jgi:TusA-related sulfurtransferase